MALCQPKLAAGDGCNRYTFKADWRDLESCNVTEFVLSYYLNDGAIELFDVRKRRVFLKKRIMPNVSLKDLFVGNSVNIMARQINILDYGDECTRQHMMTRMQRTFGLLKPELFANFGMLIDIIQQEGFTIGQMRTVQLTNDQGMELYSSLKGTAEVGLIVQHITSGTLVPLELRGNNAVKHWIDFVGPSDPEEARKTHPSSLSARFGQDSLRNGFYCAQDDADVERLMKLFFNRQLVKSAAIFTDSTCCVIKPHAVQAGLAGKIIEDINQAGFKVNAAKLVVLDTSAAEEFLEIYRGLLPEYASMVLQLSCGACIPMEIIGKGPETPSEFRELAGPADPEVARKLRPHTLRAKYGKDKVANAVHCTDLPEDGILEVEYFFKLL